MKLSHWLEFGLVTVFVVAVIVVVSCGKDDNKPAPTPKVVSVQIGTPALPGMTYSWTPVEGLSNPNVAQPLASPKKTTEYTLTVKSECGTAESKVKVRVFQKQEDDSLLEVL